MGRSEPRLSRRREAALGARWRGVAALLRVALRRLELRLRRGLGRGVAARGCELRSRSYGLLRQRS